MRRSADPKDARRQVIRLTRRGMRLITRAHRARIEFLRAIAADIPREELAVAAAALNRLRENAARSSALHRG